MYWTLYLSNSCLNSLTPAIQIQRMDLSEGPVVPHLLFNQQLVIGKGSDLRGMGDAQHLMAAGGLLQLLANTPGGKARNTICRVL